jgi:NDP-sugar pyrophosphorylase family protein
VIPILDFLPALHDEFPFLPRDLPPWALVARLREWLPAAGLPERTPGIWADASATVEAGAVVKPPAVLGAGCFVAATAYLRGGILLGAGVTIGPGVEVKASVVMSSSSFAHFNFVGESLIGRGVNLEAGAVVANRWNERNGEPVIVHFGGRSIATGLAKFGAIVGDGCRVGANAVLSPGTVLAPGTAVPRLALIDQSRG